MDFNEACTRVREGDIPTQSIGVLKEKPLDSSQIGPCIVINAGPEVHGIVFLGEKRDQQVIY